MLPKRLGYRIQSENAVVVPIRCASNRMDMIKITATFMVKFNPNGRIENTVVDRIIGGGATYPDEIGIVESSINICHPDICKLGFKIVDVSFDKIPKVLFLGRVYL